MIDRKFNFSIKRILVWEMEESEKMKQIKIEIQNKAIESFEEFTKMKFKEIVFDSEKDNWKKYSSVLFKKVKGRENEKLYLLRRYQLLKLKKRRLLKSLKRNYLYFLN